MQVGPNIELLNMDCMEYMATLPDKAFDLAIVDPPYNWGASKSCYVNKNTAFKRRFQRHGGEKDMGGFVVGGNHPNSLSEPPSQQYFIELLRVSAEAIIWGAQTFSSMLPESMEWVFWDKRTGDSYFGDGELAWTSFGGAVRMYRPSYLPAENKIHPTQKPVALYRWLLQNYAKPGQRILDTHLGSGSIAIACDIEGFDLVGCEIDADYIAGARKRLADHRAQPRMFDAPKPTATQLEIDRA
jgi:site-specific DNA-methyltransferase (adenine-specific)